MYMLQYKFYKTIIGIFVYNLIGKGQHSKHVHWDANSGFLAGMLGMANEKWKELSFLKIRKQETRINIYYFEMKLLLRV